MNPTLDHNRATSIEREDKQLELAKRFGLPVVQDLSGFAFVKNNIAKLPYHFVKKRLALPVAQEQGIYVIALSKPGELDIIEELKYHLKAPFKQIYCSQNKLEEAIEQCYQQHDREALEYIQDLQSSTSTMKDEDDEAYDLLDQKSEAPVIRMFNIMLIEAIQQGASDIHFEPQESSLIVRYRIDGVLQHRHAPPRDYQSQLLTRIKVMAKLDIAEHRLPQDGRIKLKMAGRQIDFRVSTVPTTHGERIVLRILDKGNVVLGLDKIGMPEHVLKAFKKHLCQNQGIVLVTGPTGSGKTTTLYSGISEVASSEINIMTIEDHVEYKLQGMAQIGVNPKIHLTFATGLRHILRQDPDVIMIGEIRDKETAEIAIQASLTGHLVLSTLHTNDAPSALTRLVDMGIESYLLSSSVIAVLAQRLVRTICLECKVGYTPTKSELDEINLTKEDLSLGQLYYGKGCPTCFSTGYKGRQGIYELMNMSTTIKRQLLVSPDAMQLQKAALSHGMSSLRQEGARLASLGLTTSSEVLRVTRQIQLDE